MFYFTEYFFNQNLLDNKITKSKFYFSAVKRKNGRSRMKPKDTDVSIAYQNKDIVSKLFGSQMRGKALALFGLKSDLKVVDVKPTNIPIVQARELRMDNLFELEDGSIAILDYESEYKKENFAKYGRYTMDVFERYLREGKEPDIHMMVLYTADIEKSETVLRRTAFTIEAEVSYLVEVPSEEWLADAKRKIDENTITDEVLMHLVILPLTYKGEEKKQQAIKECVNLAKQILDKEQETFVLAGILAFTDKVINEKTKNYIKEVLGMTEVGKMLIDEGRQEIAKKTARNMLKRGDSLEEIAEVLELPVETIKAWEQESCAVV